MPNFGIGGHACVDSVLQYLQIFVKLRIDISGKEIFHCGKVMLHIVFVKGIVISNPICKLNVNRRKSGFHQFQIHKESPRSAVAVNKRMNALKFNMKACQFCNDVFRTFCIIAQPEQPCC